MKKTLNIFVCYLIISGLIFAGQAWAYTKKEVETALREKVSDEEYDLINKEAESSGKSIQEIFDEVIDPKREQEIQDNVKKRHYIGTSEKNYQEKAKSQEGQGQVPEEKSEGAAGSEGVAVPQEEPISIKPSKTKSRSTVYTGEKNKNDAKLRAKQKAESGEETVVEKVGDAASAEPEKAKVEEKNKEKLESEPTIKKNRKEVDRKGDVVRSSDRRKKVEDYNRTKKKNKFGTKMLEEDTEDKGFETKGFKKKEFGTKVISDHKSKNFSGPDDTFEKKGFKKKMFRTGTYSESDRKTSMFGKHDDEDEEDAK